MGKRATLSPEEKLEHDATQAASFAFHCAKEFRKNGGTYEEFMQQHGPYLKELYKRERGGR